MVSKMRSLPTINDITRAQARIAPYAPITPILHSPLFKEKYGVDVYLKADSLSPSGSFKLRGAVNALCLLNTHQKGRGVVAFSTGNHAQAVAYAAGLLGIRATIIMPNTAPSIKIANTRAFGAEVILFDPLKENRETLAERLIDEQGKTLIHPYDDFDVIAGQGVSGLECCTQLRGLDIEPNRFYLAISGGGYIAGFGIAKDEYFLNAKLIGVEPSVSAPWHASLESQERISVEPCGKSICDAIMPPSPRPGSLPWQIAKTRLSQIETVNDEDALIGMACAIKYFGLVTEPSGACGLGVVVRDQELLLGQKVMVVVSGRNVDPDVLDQATTLINQV